VYACGTTGWIKEDLTSTDIWVVRYRANGTVAWSRTWGGPDGRSDDAEGMVVDRAGNVYVAGSTVRAAGSRDSVVLKYTPSGALKWATVYAASALEDEARSIGLDAAGKVYVCDNGNGRLQIFTRDGVFVNAFPVAGWQSQVYSEPYVTLDPRGTLWVTIPGAKEVRNYDTSGKLLRTITRTSLPNATFDTPMGISYSAASRELVISDLEHRLVRIPLPEK